MVDARQGKAERMAVPAQPPWQYSLRATEFVFPLPGRAPGQFAARARNGRIAWTSRCSPLLLPPAAKLLIISRAMGTLQWQSAGPCARLFTAYFRH